MYQIPTPTVDLMKKMNVSIRTRYVGQKEGPHLAACDVIDDSTGVVFHTATDADEKQAVVKAVDEAVHVAKPLTPAQAYAMSQGVKIAQAESADKIKSLEEEVAALKAALVEKSTKKIKPPVDPANTAHQ